MAGGEGRSCSRNSFVVDGFPDGCGGSGGGQELAKAGRAEALGGSCGEYDALEMGQAERKSVVLGKSVSVRVDLGGRRIIKKKNNIIKQERMTMTTKQENLTPEKY